MISKDSLKKLISDAVHSAGLEPDAELLEKVTVDYPEPQFGDYSTNAAMVLAKPLKINPRDLAEKIKAGIAPDYFDKIEIAGPGFINFFVKRDFLLAELQVLAEQGVGALPKQSEKILVEYFQPNIAKPLHVGHLRTAIIGDAVKRMLLYLGYAVESDTHLGDWGTQFGYLILIQKKHGLVNEKLYAELNNAAKDDPAIHEAAKAEFAKLEQGDAENRKIWKAIVDESVQQFMGINDLMDILPFDHHWPESFYADKMPAVLDELKAKNILFESQGAQIVNLEDQNLGIAVIVKSDGSTTYLLRDLATFIYRKKLGFARQLYLVDNRQSLSFKQMFAILQRMGIETDGSRHLDYGFISFKGEALSTRKGNMVLANDVIKTAQDKVAKIIAEKNPDLKNKDEVVKAVAKGALKYFDLSHNRHSDIEFDWDEALSFEGNSGPYLQYVYARLSSILRKAEQGEAGGGRLEAEEVTDTERQIMFALTKLPDVVAESMKDYLPNILVNYLHNLSALINKFYHESPVAKEENQNTRNFRLVLVAACKQVLGQGLDLLGIKALEEM
jgi:arginyl-tRNA synthetase